MPDLFSGISITGGAVPNTRGVQGVPGDTGEDAEASWPSFNTTSPQLGAAVGDSISLSKTVSLNIVGAAPTAGTLTLVGGTKLVSTTAATSTALLFFQRLSTGGTIGFATTYTIDAGVSFTLTSDSALDTSVYQWHIVETH